ncbi:angiogenic factor with G patch and FHA domains 1 isoform X1 [Gymnodraco acuticeps]|uniref:Angiogenic factor with G patch and FHA domains 1 isoform X1 n=1 Tax=Gymnodraco acuticeps TaxID=8218 RepID=A0A6P8WE46_GYMAC|nr:angiogenic factor with G patch and FHA domains 1 isoform X1 [Gymnodraco acuticeps]XP_034095455.1 angiogenic factor with G patch and FHA domains 1 isoform X1 [Gymnodraco acuticeps]XP_034095456.1 angiogenic factor with G patch and FHA domains 1 isoform X1 [Gymnodraco acuticeps]XP_034095457.1 angiogenic factor with G patch and FHA domains 1 isoform X1 [Gymnodraco acuticeps]
MHCQRHENDANVDIMENEDGENETESEGTELRLKVESLKQELHECRAELAKLQKQLKQSERLQQNTESYNEDLRKQVDQLSAEIHQRKKKDKDRVDSETQTEEYVWTETDYYNYYYGGNTQNPEASDSQEGLNAAAVEAADGSNTAGVSAPNETTTTAAAADVDNPTPDNGVEVTTEEGDGGSIADILRATAEEAMTQTGFVFDETHGLYYDHSTGFYYDSGSQLYYDANTGIYYYHDTESGRYQFHSKIEVPAAQTAAEPCKEKSTGEWKGRKSKKGSKKSSHQDNKELKFDEVKLEEEEIDWVERPTTKRSTESRKLKRKSCSPDTASRRKDSHKHRADSDKSSSKRKKQKKSSHDDDKDKGRSKKKSKKSKTKKKKKKKSPARSDDSDDNSEPEEGELTESEREEWDSTPSASSSSSSSKESSEAEMETQINAAKEIWPPCVRVTVVRSPVMQVGTLFIITATSPATIGREKSMDHAILLSELGVSKFHAEVYFDQEQQGYMLVDQGSQNGTVINGNRILQPKTKCEPQALMHGDEVKMGETVLSFHIHPGTDTCDGCEPGQVMAHINKYKREENTAPAAPTKEDKEALRQKELKQMKARYGLQSSEYEEAKALRNPRYQDRAESRRQTVGSEGVFQRDDAPASVHQEISEVNKGRKMLEKMGWKKGEGLGKEGTGMKTPIQLKIRKSQSGLGAGAALSLDAASVTKSKSQKNWEKARERFADTCQPDVPSPQTPKNKAWVKGEETADTEAGVETEGQSLE